MTTVAQLLNKGQQRCQHSETAKLDAELLLCFCLKASRSYLRAWPENDVSSDITERYNALLLRREKGEPVAYLIGERGFWTLDLRVNHTTLIPRPETELLVESVLQLLPANEHKKILDLGTGTGAIALALASERPQWQLLACDREPGAVALAQSNQRDCDLHNVRIIQSDWFSHIDSQTFDVIVSNPPYIDANDPHLNQGDVRYEPRSALVAKNNGLADITLIIKHACDYLAPGAWLVFEHGYNQAKDVRDLLMGQGFDKVFCKKDLAGVDRVSGGQFTDGRLL
ncbi:MAG: peptide chain release factor N(5)-glutamine methyltransferase [Spongiibacteraceae bacterium]|nr:peptide chain release factor N(5)-glutamine methyltransferase [Spongiibacteraceae bacterium]